MANLAQLLTDQAAKQPDHPAILAGHRVISYAEFDDAAARVAAFLISRGFQAGDRAGLMLPNVPEFCIVCYGVLRVGGTVVPMNPLLKSREVGYYLGDSGASLLFAAADSPGEPAAGAAAAGADFIPVGAADLAALLQAQPPAPDVVDRADDDTALILYTSGTTGQPKGAELSHANLRTNAQLSAETLFSLSPSDVVMGCLPLFHVFGLTCGLNTAVSAGAALALLARFDPGQALELIQRCRVTVFEGVPTMYAALLHQPDRDRYDTSSLRVCVSGGAALPVELLRGFEAAFGTMILEGYGLSETSPVASFNHPDQERKPGSIGTPVRGVQFRLVAPDDSDVPGRPGRRDRGARAERDEGLLGPAGSDQGDHPGRLAAHRRPGPAGRGRLLLHRGPQEGPDHPGRLQRLPAGDRGGALRAPGGGRGGGHRHPGRNAG